MKKHCLTMLIAAACLIVSAQNGRPFKYSPDPQPNSVCSANMVADSSFEAGPSGADWVQTSTNFGTPLCTINTCGLGNGTGPHTGSFWAWFGGITSEEEGSVSQSVVLPQNATANLYFFLEIPSCAPGGFLDYMAVIIDGTDTVFTATDESPLCGAQSYALQTVNLDAYSDGNAHNIRFYGHTFSNTNFFVDDVSVISCPFTTGIQNDYTISSVRISPNPVHDKLKISFGSLEGDVKIEITNLLGQSFYNESISLATSDQKNYYVPVGSLLENGIYFVIVKNGQKIYTKKFVVQ